MVIDNKYEIGDLVYIKTDSDQKECLIVGIKINPGNLVYFVSTDQNEFGLYDFEITKEINILKKTK